MCPSARERCRCEPPVAECWRELCCFSVRSRRFPLCLPLKRCRRDSWPPSALPSTRRVSVFVADRRAGGVVVLDLGSGEVTRRIPFDGITSVATAWDDRLLLGSASGAVVTDLQGSTVLALDSSWGPLRVTGVAADATLQRYAVLYGSVGRVECYDTAGSVVLSFGAKRLGRGFRGATGLAIDSSGKFLRGRTGATGKIHVFDSSGDYVRSIGDRGAYDGEFSQLSDLAVDDQGKLYAADSFLNRVQIFDGDGTLTEIVGSYGAELGKFKTPTGLAIANDLRKLIVVSQNGSDLHVFDLDVEPASQGPTIPEPVLPEQDEVLGPDLPVVLDVLNSFDPDSESLEYEFELYRDLQGELDLLDSRLVDEGDTTTEVDVSTAASATGGYLWRARASDGDSYSGWCVDQRFQMAESNQPNGPPGIPTPLDPVGGAEVPDLVPLLEVQNAVDPDGDLLSYTFELSLRSGVDLETVATSPAVAEGVGVTSWSVPEETLALSQEVFWRCRAHDGYVYGEWSNRESFWTPPIPIPSLEEVGDVPGGGRVTTRRGSLLAGSLRSRRGSDVRDLRRYGRHRTGAGRQRFPHSCRPRGDRRGLVVDRVRHDSCRRAGARGLEPDRVPAPRPRRLGRPERVPRTHPIVDGDRLQHGRGSLMGLARRPVPDGDPTLPRSRTRRPVSPMSARTRSGRVSRATPAWPTRSPTTTRRPTCGPAAPKVSSARRSPRLRAPASVPHRLRICASTSMETICCSAGHP